MATRQYTAPTAGLTDEEIIEGLRNRDPQITRDYFYGICRIAYHIYDKYYKLELKLGMDFYSVAHEYYLSLDKYDFRQLEDRKPGMTLKTWMVNGFRFVLLDRLKSYNREYRMQSIEARAEKAKLSFDIPDNNFSKDFRDTVEDICHSLVGRDDPSSIILKMILLEGFKGKEVANQLGITPSAVSQRYHKLMEDVVIPYFKRNYIAPYDTRKISLCIRIDHHKEEEGNARYSVESEAEQPQIRTNMYRDSSNRITPEFITSLKPNEIFVFGSNLAGMHGGGAARMARLHFGAILGNGDGPQGQSYAIPTMQGGVKTIRPYVDKFIDYAKAHPEQIFLVTPIGCGIAGFMPCDIAPLFRDAARVKNIRLPQSFWNVLRALGVEMPT